MTTENLYEPTRTVGNGVTVAFTVSFKIDDETDLDVYLIDTGANTNKALQTLTTDYTVTINTTSEGGTITFLTAPPSTKDVIIERTEDYKQPTDIPDVATIQESVIEGSLDKNTRLIQQILEITNRKIGITVEDETLVSAFDTNIQDFTSGALLQINSTATGIGATNLADISLSAIGLPTTSGIAVFTGTNTFISRQILTSGSVIVVNPTGVAGDITVDSTVTDNNIATKAATADLASTANGLGASLIGLEDVAGDWVSTDLELLAIELADLKVVTGTYTGDGNATQVISGIPFPFRVVRVYGGSGTAGSQTGFVRNDTHTGADSFNYSTAVIVTDGIIAIGATNFTVGNSANINQLNTSYSFEGLV